MHLYFLILSAILPLTRSNHEVTAKIKAEEQKNNAVTVTIYLASVNEWNSEILSHFRSKVISKATEYCKVLTTCGLTHSITFAPSNFHIEQGYPRQAPDESSNLEAKFYIEFPDNTENTTITQFLLSGKVLADITKDVRLVIYDSTGFSMISVSGGGTTDSYLPRSSYLLNAIIIPCSVVVLLLVIALACGLHRYRKYKTSARSRANKVKLIEKKKRKGRGLKKVRPTIDEENDLGIAYHKMASKAQNGHVINEQTRRNQERAIRTISEHRERQGKLPPLQTSIQSKSSKERKTSKARHIDGQGHNNLAYDSERSRQTVHATIQEETEATETETNYDGTSVTQSESTYTEPQQIGVITPRHAAPSSHSEESESEEETESESGSEETDTESEQEHQKTVKQSVGEPKARPQ